MEIIRDHENLDIPGATVATIGTFDGVHLGHRRIIEATTAAASTLKMPSLLLTFDVHPRQVLTPALDVEVLTSLEEKLRILGQFSLDRVVVLNFRKISRLTADEFCRQVLVDKSHVERLFVGTNFKFGAGATGDVTWLKNNCPELAVTEFPLETADDTVISSTKIRQLLKAGAVEEIPALLGSYPSLTGRVVRGAGRGGGLGFPTANLEFDHGLCLPGHGVYTGYLLVDDKTLPSVINCGTNPTFENGGFHCEAHVLDYHADLYGSRVKLQLTTRLRDERRFPSPEALSRQITDDVHKAREWFGRQESRK